MYLHAQNDNRALGDKRINFFPCLRISGIRSMYLYKRTDTIPRHVPVFGPPWRKWRDCHNCLFVSKYGGIAGALR